MITPIHALGAAFVFCSIAGCSADSDGASTAASNTAVGYETLSSSVDVTSTLGGVALKLRENPDQVSVSASSGSIRPIGELL